MIPVVTEANGMVVITHVIPSTGQQAGQVVPNVHQIASCQVPVALQKFFKGEPKTLGATQILIGILQIFFGVVLAVIYPTVFNIFVISGVPFWSGLFFIISGSLSVAAQNHAHMCLVKGSLGMNIMSSISACVGIIIIGLDLGVGINLYFYNSDSYSCYNYEYGTDCLRYRSALLNVVPGIEGVLLLLMLLELCISISTSAFGCKASCCKSNSNMQSVITVPNESRPEMFVNAVAPPMYNVKNQNRQEVSCPSVPAPAYTESV
uniref:Membrane-spanning 4-domains subfamily A member 4A-like n=1 Tax=Geotrypetes seraphini TaxID=260995 RepID=A0A6P8P723_GEOSA|nr:membrane-spanning 4-domains subfamily A member 4A-like [Geotrypetes seraphini]XP_033776660.1 membrane-spanning 4-domains subfamily A member 4A-like [Geotrypetes seraphini]XP_033776662.1 membrane-spanning 4-domains subfamily A member 4A-like [Geotrypetes seraphini]